jgi:putative ABC transport system permease protein
MTHPRWRKMLHDLWGNKVRSLLVMATIFMGVFAVGFVSNIMFIGVPEMNADFNSVNPHAAVLYTDPFTDDLLPSLARLPGIGEVEGRSSVSARVILPSGEKKQIAITAIPPAGKMRIDQLRPFGTATSLPPLAKHEAYLESSVTAALPFKAGDSLQIELFDGQLRILKVAALTHDVTSIPYTFGQELYAFVQPETMDWLGGSQDYNELLLTVAEQKTDEATCGLFPRR